MIVVVLWAMRRTTLPDEVKSPWEIVGVVPLLIISAATLISRSIQRSREQFEIVADSERLRATLTSLHAGPEASVEVPAAVMENVARIEHAQIARERAQAVLAGVSAANRGYGVQLARSVLEQKASLPANLRLEVEDLIDQLTAEPYPSAAQRADGTLSARTPDGSAEVGYSVDEQNRRIHVLAIRTEPTRGSHAL